MAVIKMEGYHFYLLVCFVIPAVSFQFRKRPNNPLVVYYKNRTNVELRWEWTLLGGEILSPIKIKRYRKSQTNTEAIIATYFASPYTDATKYSFNVVNNMNGYASFVIKDITNQGNINVMAENEVYIYKIVVDEQVQSKEYTDEVELNTFKTPSITKYPKNQTATGGTVTFTCAADGKPTPTIKWEKIGSSQSFTPGSPLTITNFDVSKVGVYRCTAKSVGIAENATGTGTVQFTTCGSGCYNEDLGIEFPDLTYNYEYENSNYNKYKELKSNIETACLIAYAVKGKTIHKCEVRRFGRGSVVAVVELGYPTNTVDPKQPLLQAINDGNFAGYKVNTAFVSLLPSLTPTQIPTTSDSKVLTGNPTTGATVTPGADTSSSVAIAVCATIIVILVISNAVMGFLLWKKNSELREIKNIEKSAPNEHPLYASIGVYSDVTEDRQPEVPTAPIYHEATNVNDGPVDHPSQTYQTLDKIHNSNVPEQYENSVSVPCSDEPSCQTYQTLDVATKNTNNSIESFASDNYQALQDTMSSTSNYEQLK